MSLPSRAMFYNIYDELIGSSFINVGWCITSRSVLGVIRENFPKKVFDDPRIHYVEMYDYTFPMDMICDLLIGDEHECLELLDAIGLK